MFSKKCFEIIKQQVIDNTYLQIESHPIDIFPILSCLELFPIPEE